MSTTPQERDDHILDVGKRCSHKNCNLVDFLPFKCNHCTDLFCQEHFMAKAHECPKYEEFKHNRVAPDCPFCKTPIAIPQDADPNVILERHFGQECPVYSGRTKKKASPTCARVKCGKTLFSPITCDKCRKQFCPAHRFPSDHDCSAPASTSTTTKGPTVGIAARGLTAGSRLLNLVPAPTANKSTASASKAAAAPETLSSNALSNVTSITANVKNPFNKTDSLARPSAPIAPPVYLKSTGTINNSLTTTLTINNLNSTNNLNRTNSNKPEPVIKSTTSFIPPPLFAAA